jgi:16S rRNA (guanine1207-N2)-methyltransferase
MNNIRDRNNTPRLKPTAVHVSMLADPTRSGRRDVLLDGRLEVVSWKGVASPDRLLIETADATPGERILAAMVPTGLTPLALKLLRPDAAVACYHVDLFNVASARNLAARHDDAAVATFCEAVIPSPPVLFDAAPDLALFSLRADDEKALSIELLHQLRHRLARGGRLLAVINDPRDNWLAKQLEKIFGNLTRAAHDKRAVVYSVKQRDPPLDVLDADASTRELFLHRVEVPAGDEKLSFETCYGVFVAHKLDDGSGALLNELRLPEPRRAVLDLGCGWGGLGILAARRCGAERLVMTDANARAVEMARRNLLRHGPPGGETRLEANAESLMESDADAGAFDLVVSNPPYATEFRVAELFIQAAHRALRPGGRVQMVAKNNPKLAARIKEVFGNATETRRWGYQIVTAESAGSSVT